jgi:purine-binding chemotaxis protein CheW
MSTFTSSAEARAASEAARQVVVFSLHGEDYALPITSVREIIRYTAPSATGGLTGLIQGMIVLRGHVLPVVDISLRLGRSLDPDDSTKILVIELDAGAVGLIVDAVEEVLLIPADQIDPLPAAEDGLGAEIAKVGDRLIVLVDPERALAGALG